MSPAGCSCRRPGCGIVTLREHSLRFCRVAPSQAFGELSVWGGHFSGLPTVRPLRVRLLVALEVVNRHFQPPGELNFEDTPFNDG